MTLFTLQGKSHSTRLALVSLRIMVLPFWKILHNLTPKEGAACGRELPLPFAKQWRDSRSRPCTDLPLDCAGRDGVTNLDTLGNGRVSMHVCEPANTHLSMLHEPDGTGVKA